MYCGWKAAVVVDVPAAAVCNFGASTIAGTKDTMTVATTTTY